MKTITAADANRQFSRLLRDVRAGETVTVTAHGKPVARIEPVTGTDAAEIERDAARQRLWRRLDTQPALNLGKFDRADAYER